MLAALADSADPADSTSAMLLPEPAGPSATPTLMFAPCSRFAFSTRHTELNAIARPAIIGLNSQPVNG